MMPRIKALSLTPRWHKPSGNKKMKQQNALQKDKALNAKVKKTGLFVVHVKTMTHNIKATKKCLVQ